MSNDKLFAGEPGFFGGLSNETELAELCPAGFKTDNPWSDYASRLFSMGGSSRNWKWKSDDGDVCKRQMGCLHGLLGTFELSHQDKLAVAGWMLSEMLAEVPADKE